MTAIHSCVGGSSAPCLKVPAKSPLTVSPSGAGLCQKGDHVFWRGGNGKGVCSYKCVLVIIFGTSLSLCVALERRNPSLTASERWCPSALCRAWSKQVDCDSVSGVPVSGDAQKYSALLRLCNCPRSSLAAVISEVQRQGSLLSLLPV